MAVNHHVRQGECISSVAFEHGFLPDTIWEHPANAELRLKRVNPNVLSPGDPVFIPDKRPKEVTKPTEQTHCFVMKAVPVSLNLQILDDSKPVADERYTLDVDGRLSHGTTDGEGRIQAVAMPNAARALLVVGGGERQRAYRLILKEIDPVDEKKPERLER